MASVWDRNYDFCSNLGVRGSGSGLQRAGKQKIPEIF